jgi:hypothetical protein
VTQFLRPRPRVSALELVAEPLLFAGVSAKPIRRRFSEEVSAQLERIAWWNWTRPELEARFLDLRDMTAFLKKYGSLEEQGSD